MRREQVRAELLAHHPLPRVELEEHGDRALVQVAEEAAVPADVGDVDRRARRCRPAWRCRAGSRGCPGPRRCRPRRRSARCGRPGSPAAICFQRSISRSWIELNWSCAGKTSLQPVPLHHARLEQRRGRVGVVLEHLRLARAVPGEVEAAEERLLVVVPGLLDERDEGLGDAEALVVAALDHAPGGVDAARLQLARGELELVDLGGGEPVAGALVPVDAVDRVEVEAQLLDLAGPVDAGNEILALHRRALSWPRSGPRSRSRRARSSRTSPESRTGSRTTTASRRTTRSLRPQLPSRDERCAYDGPVEEAAAAMARVGGRRAVLGLVAPVGEAILARGVDVAPVVAAAAPAPRAR